MFARVTFSETPPTLSVDERRQAALKHMLPWLRQQPGFRGAFILVDDKGESIAGTVWDSLEEMRATRETVDEMRENVGRVTGLVHTKVEEFTVVLYELV